MSEASSNLCLHSGGKEVSLQELLEYKAPPPQGRWYPVSHHQVYSRVSEMLEAAGYEVEKTKLAVARNGNRFFGVMDLKNSVAAGVCLSVGVRNSIDKSFPLGFCAGSRVNERPR